MKQVDKRSVVAFVLTPLDPVLTESPTFPPAASNTAVQPEPTILIRDLRVTYGSGDEALCVLDIPEWSVGAGQQQAIFGPSGSGKSTLLHVLSGIILPTSGSVRVCGEELDKLKEAERDRFRAHHIGYVFQNLNLLSGYTAVENTLLGATFAPRRATRAEAEELLVQMGLKERLRHTPAQLSFGEQQRVAIARALVKRPALVLADEPTGSLDPRNTLEVVRLLRSACEARGSTLALVSHDMSVIEAFPDRIEFGRLNCGAGAAR